MRTAEDEDFKSIIHMGRPSWLHIPTGRIVPQVRGGDGPDDGNDENDEGGDDDDPPAKVTLTQSRLNKIMAKEKNEGKKSAIGEFVKELGFDGPESLKAALAGKASSAAEGIQAAQKAAREEAAGEFQAQMEAIALEHEMVTSLMEEGMGVAAARRAAKLLEDVEDTEDIPDAIKNLKATFPALFGDNTNSGKKDETKPNRSGSSAPRPKGRSETKDQAKSADVRALETLHARHPHLAKKGKS
ncbi:MAG: hypothetical protein E6R03_12795 [Hyphomicrobiaceae bacterium]|nr:MAG: hypothetical protein E6R03_12795 [Hyphomicrobiaceae bacterium]